MITTHNIRVLHASDTVLATLVNQNILVRVTDEAIHGTSGIIYRPSDELLRQRSLAALSDLDFALGPTTIACNAYSLPPEEYAALLEGSPEFCQHSLAHLIAPLTETMDAADRQAWTAQLVEAVTRPPVRNNAPHLLPHRPAQRAAWLPERTRFVHSRYGWLLVLAFEISSHEPRYVVKGSAAGIDIGLRTLAVASHKTGLLHKARGVTDIQITNEHLAGLLPARAELWSTVQRLSVTLQHAAAREQLAQFMEVLLSAATVVGFEDLRYDDMGSVFKRRARELGLRDFLRVWLPRRLRQAGICAVVVPPDRTSVLCNQTFLRGHRDRQHLDTLVNSHGDSLDADENAAANIRDRALGILLSGRA